MGLKLIFDLDETLVPEYEPVNAALAEVCRDLAGAVDQSPERMAALVRRHASELWHANPLDDWCRRIGLSSWEALANDFGREGQQWATIDDWRRESRFEVSVWQRVLDDCGADGAFSAETLAAAFTQLRQSRPMEFYDGAGEVLAAAGRAGKPAMLTNGASRPQRRKLASAGLDGLFDPIVVSGEIGVGKPDPAAMEHVLDRLGAAPSECVMIGNSLRNDIAPAAALGMKTVWVNHDGVLNPGGATAWAEVRNLRQLLQIEELFA